MSVLVPQAPLVHLRDRLRSRLVEKELVDDPSLLTLLSDGYVNACEASGCLQRIGTLVLTGGVAEYPLPTGCVEVQDVVLGGDRVTVVALADALKDRGGGAPQHRYHYASTIGFTPAPPQGSSALILYTESPSRFATWGDVPDPRYPIEYLYALNHYVRWRVTMMAGGAQRISLGQAERAWYDDAVSRLRRATLRRPSTGPVRVTLGERIHAR